MVNMKAFVVLLALAILSIPAAAAEQLTDHDKVILIRGLMAEQATVKTLLPRSKKPLPFESTGKWDTDQWDEAAQEMGPAARVGDAIQITKVDFEKDKIVLEINGGLKSGRKWYDRIQVGMGNRTSPIGASGQPTTGTNLAIVFPGRVPVIKPADVKAMLKPILDFDARSVTEIYTETLPPEMQEAIAEKKPLEGMNSEQLMLAMGRPVRKTREVKDGMELEDWIYGEAPGKITFVTMHNGKVIKIKESYAGIGLEAAPRLPAQR